METGHQGSPTREWVISQLLFNIFVHDLPSELDTNTHQFADDTTLSEASKSLDIISEKLSAGYSRTKEFCQSRGLALNPAKTQLIIFKSAGKRLPDDFALTIDSH